MSVCEYVCYCVHACECEWGCVNMCECAGMCLQVCVWMDADECVCVSEYMNVYKGVFVCGKYLSIHMC